MSETLPQEPSNSPPTSPPTFEDASGKTWSIKLTLGLCDEVQEAVQVDLIPDDNDLSPIVAVALSGRRFAKLLWHCVREQAEAKGISEKQFTGPLEAEHLYNGCYALRSAIDFFIRRTRGPVQADAAIGTFDGALTMADTAAAAMLEALKSAKTQEVIREVYNEAGKAALAEMRTSLSDGIRQHSLRDGALAGSAIS